MPRCNYPPDVCAALAERFGNKKSNVKEVSIATVDKSDMLLPEPLWYPQLYVKLGMTDTLQGILDRFDRNPEVQTKLSADVLKPMSDVRQLNATVTHGFLPATMRGRGSGQKQKDE